MSHLYVPSSIWQFLVPTRKRKLQVWCTSYCHQYYIDLVLHIKRHLKFGSDSDPVVNMIKTFCNIQAYWKSKKYKLERFFLFSTSRQGEYSVLNLSFKSLRSYARIWYCNKNWKRRQFQSYFSQTLMALFQFQFFQSSEIHWRKTSTQERLKMTKKYSSVSILSDISTLYERLLFNYLKHALGLSHLSNSVDLEKCFSQ